MLKCAKTSTISAAAADITADSSRFSSLRTRPAPESDAMTKS